MCMHVYVYVRRGACVRMWSGVHACMCVYEGGVHVSNVLTCKNTQQKCEHEIICHVIHVHACKGKCGTIVRMNEQHT